MSTPEFSTFYRKPCRFKMKSGKEVYGVIWEDNDNGISQHFFASSGEYENYLEAQQKNDLDGCEQFKTEVDIRDVVDATQIEI